MARDYKFNSYGEGARILKELGFELQSITVLPSPIPKNYPTSGGSPLGAQVVECGFISKIQ
jgi:hypothetical protein